MRHNVEALQRMSVHLDGARRELDAINREQALLDFEETNFPLLQAMFQAKDPYDKLWTTALSFTLKSEEWMNGETHHFYYSCWVCLSASIVLFVRSVNSPWLSQD